MDPTRFDALTRWWDDASSSRRGALKLLMAGSFGTLLEPRLSGADGAKRKRGNRGRRARTQDSRDTRVIGLTCRSAVSKHVGPPYGQKCTKRADVAKHHPPHGCCPGASCLRGTPLAPVKGKASGRCYGDDGHQERGDGFCEKIPPRPCVGLNVACNALDVCCDLVGPAVDCAIVEPQKGRTRCDATVQAYVAQCCVNEGTACGNDCQCCGALRCQNGNCAPPPDICHALAESCADGEPCCPDAGTCHGGRCCSADGAACGILCASEESCQACCSGYCRGDGRCGPVAGCTEYGQVCTTGAECCNAVPCTAGRCRYT